MKFRIEHDALADVVAWVARALPSRPVVPVLSGLRLEAGDGLTLSCFDYELAATAHVAPADVAEPGTALVPGRLLAEITRSLPGQPAEFTRRRRRGQPDLRQRRVRAGLAAHWPSTPNCRPRRRWPARSTAASWPPPWPRCSRPPAATTRFRCSPRSAWTSAATSLTLAATDRYRLAVRELQWEPAHPGMRAIALVPGRTLADAARVDEPGRAGVGGVRRRRTPGGRGAGPAAGRGHDQLRCGGRRLTGRLIAGEFIRYQSRFPDGYGCRAEMPAASLIEAVRRVSLVADRASPVRLTFGPAPVVVEAQTEGRARAIGGGDRELRRRRARDRLQPALPARRADRRCRRVRPGPAAGRYGRHPRPRPPRSGWSSPARPSPR